MIDGGGGRHALLGRTGCTVHCPAQSALLVLCIRRVAQKPRVHCTSASTYAARRGAHAAAKLQGHSRALSGAEDRAADCVRAQGRGGGHEETGGGERWRRLSSRFNKVWIGLSNCPYYGEVVQTSLAHAQDEGS